ASAPETFAVAVSFNNPYTPCDASLEWPSRGLVYKPPPCDVIQHMLFHPNGTMLSLWADRENEVWKLLTWAPDEEAPSEVAQGELPPLDARLAGLALRGSDGAVIVSAYSSDARGIRLAVVEPR